MIFIFFLSFSKLSSKDTTILTSLDLFMTVVVLIGDSVSQNTHDSIKYMDALIENEIQQKLEEIKNIGDSIDLFYLPLHDLLTTYNENIVNKAKLRKIAEINGHKHLAELRVRGAFEKYIQANEGNNREYEKLLELVNRDIKFLQNRYIELKSELKTE